MCVIIIKKAGQDLPGREMLQAAFAANPDGCGYVTSTKKHYKTLDFGCFYSNLVQDVKREEDVVMHFRWATHGSVSRKNCHPFFDWECGDNGDNWCAFAHNGVLSIPSENDMTDSEICFRKKIIPLLEKQGMKMTPYTKGMITRATEGASKFAMLLNGELFTFGRWETFHGYQVSNTRFAWSMAARWNYRGRRFTTV